MMTIVSLLMLLVPGLISTRIIWHNKPIEKPDYKHVISDYLCYSFLIMMFAYAFMFITHPARTVSFTPDIPATSHILSASFVFKYSTVAFAVAVGLPILIPRLFKVYNAVQSRFLRIAFLGLCLLLLALITIVSINVSGSNTHYSGYYTYHNEALPGIIFAGLRGASPYFVTDADFGEGDFPIVRIYSENPVVDRNNWMGANISISNTDEAFEFQGIEARMRGRGQSSWHWEKPPFRIRFNDARTMLDSGHAARDWTFIANHFDNSLMRNYSAYYLASLLDGMYTAPFARFVDVYFNGEYQGVYMLSIQHSYIVEGQVYLQYDPDPALSGYLLEMDSRVRTEGGTEFIDFVYVNRRVYEIRYPSGRNLTLEHAKYAQNFLYRVEVLLMQRDDAVFEYIHLPSFVDFYIVSELYKDIDVSGLSIFMQIRGTGEERRLEMGPIWDHDRSLGNDRRDANLYIHSYHPRYPYGIWAAKQNLWFRYLMQMPTFFAAVTERWNEVKYKQIPQMMAHIQNTAITYETSFERNFLRWPILGEQHAMQPCEVGEIDTFIGHVEFIIDFLERRITWLDWYFNGGE